MEMKVDESIAFLSIDHAFSLCRLSSWKDSKKATVQKHKKYEMQCYVSDAFLRSRKIGENVRCAKTHSDIRDKYFLGEIHVWITNVAES